MCQIVDALSDKFGKLKARFSAGCLDVSIAHELNGNGRNIMNMRFIAQMKLNRSIFDIVDKGTNSLNDGAL